MLFSPILTELEAYGSQGSYNAPTYIGPWGGEGAGHNSNLAWATVFKRLIENNDFCLA